MKEEIFTKLVEKMELHFGDENGGCAGNGLPSQEPYKGDLLRILVEAFQNRNKQDKYELVWERFQNNLYKEIQRRRPHIPSDHLSKILEQNQSMWDEWLYILEKLRTDNIILIDNRSQEDIEKYDGYISIETR